MKPVECKNCKSRDIKYVRDYEHLDFDGDCTRTDNGWLCDDCECFHSEDGSYFEFFSSYEEDKKVNYSQIMG